MPIQSNSLPISGSRPWLAAAFLMLGAFMNILDATIVNLALPTIRDDLDVSASGLQWVLVIYILTFGAGLLPLGRFGDIFGRKRVLIIGLLCFLATSLAAGVAPDVESLVAARGLQGLAAAAMVPQVLAIIHGLFSPEDRGKAIGLFGMINALGAVAGPVIGGFVISADLFGLGWRPIFLSAGNLSDYKGALALLSSLPKAKWLLADRGCDADWFTVSRLRHLATVLTLMPSSRLSAASVACASQSSKT